MTLQSEIAEFKAALYGEVGELDAFLEARNELELRAIWKAILEPEAKAERWLYVSENVIQVDADGSRVTQGYAISDHRSAYTIGRIKLEPME